MTRQRVVRSRFFTRPTRSRLHATQKENTLIWSMRPSRPVVLVALATAFSLLGDQTLYSVLPTCYTELGLMPYQVGLILSVNRWIRLLTNHLAERLCRRYSLTLLLMLSLTLGAATTVVYGTCLLYTSPSPRDGLLSRMPSSA